MKNKKDFLIPFLVILTFILGLAALITYQTRKDRNDLAVHIAGLGRSGTPATIEELKAAIGQYEKQIEAYVQAGAKTGIYWKILASRLQDRGLHNEALEALERAIYYTPEDPVLHYLTGISAATAAKSSHSFPGGDNSAREGLFVLAEEAYRRAIELDGRYLNPRYGIGVLYVFELDRPEEAVPHLEKYLEISKSNVDVMFILARAYFVTGNFQSAADLYSRIISLTKDEAKRLEAQNNRFAAMERLYG
ncbi:MAG: tetratricopeptide repeat protein [Treponema sp.]|jgi:tetratricopeptide (TPR) repeat protein|nr:tetratricopeptide repeat protein [Treponema sp.]